MENQLSPNALTLMALCNEYCQAVETVNSSSRSQFVNSMVRLLPRIYITAFGFQSDCEADSMLMDMLDEETYNAFREAMAARLGEDDTYLEVFESDMKYSDTPIAASISENLADLFQVFYNFIESVKDAPHEMVELQLAALRYDFESYWSQILCNVMRPLNHIALTPDGDDFGSEFN